MTHGLGVVGGVGITGGGIGRSGLLSWWWPFSRSNQCRFWWS
ncbi:hypothetical protein AB0923_02035 [Streptomyces virginiae]